MLACSFLGQLRTNNDLEDDTLHLSIAGSFSSSLMPAETRIHRATISATEFSADGLPVITKSLEADAAPSRKRWGILAFIHVFILKLKCKRMSKCDQRLRTVGPMLATTVTNHEGRNSKWLVEGPPVSMYKAASGQCLKLVSELLLSPS
uniref:Uncharacterized protein n=1 Tax=Plectus sambesii TaxID=2011161 RepID=A0A914VAJ2_9BILA